MNSNKYVNEKFKIQTITPVFIGNDQGSELSPITDYVVKRDKLLLIDQNKFENLLNENLEILDEFVFEVKNNTKNFDLEFFIEKKLNIAAESLSREIFEVVGYLGKNSIKTFINSAGRPYIPGSTIKGAIRTAIIYNWLQKTNAGLHIVNRMLTLYEEINYLNEKLENEQNENKKKNLIQKIEEIEDFIQNAEQIITLKSKRKLENEEKKELRRIDKSKHIYGKIYNEFVIFSGNKFGHDFRHIQISDTNFFDLSQTKIIELIREYLIKNETKTSQWVQVLKNQVETEFNFKIEKTFKDNFLQPINKNSYSEIFQMINTFSRDVVEFEIEQMNNFINLTQNNQAMKDKLQSVIDFYKDLKEKINASENKWAFVRIGGGKTYFDNSIGLALFKHNKEQFKVFRKLLGFWKHRSGGFVEEDSPITRTFYLENKLNKFLPIGWTVMYPETEISAINKLFGTEREENKNIGEIENAEEGSIDFSKLENLGRVKYTKERRK